MSRDGTEPSADRNNLDEHASKIDGVQNTLDRLALEGCKPWEEMSLGRPFTTVETDLLERAARASQRIAQMLRALEQERQDLREVWEATEDLERGDNGPEALVLALIRWNRP